MNLLRLVQAAGLFLALTPFTGLGPAAAQTHVVAERVLACFDQADYTRVLRLASSDQAAALKAQREALVADRCVVLGPGARVHLEPTPILSGLQAIRVPGEPRTLWTAGEALKRAR